MSHEIEHYLLEWSEIIEQIWIVFWTFNMSNTINIIRNIGIASFAVLMYYRMW